MYKAKNFTAAIEKYEKAAETLPESLKYVLNIAAAHLAMHDYEAVLVDCDRALSIASEHGSSFEDKGKALARKGKALAKLKHMTKRSLHLRIHFWSMRTARSKRC